MKRCRAGTHVMPCNCCVFLSFGFIQTKVSAPANPKAADLTGDFTRPSGSTLEAEVFFLQGGKYNITVQPDEIGKSTFSEETTFQEFLICQFNQNVRALMIFSGGQTHLTS